ncbi:hypothetical protein D3C78_1780070 [compost metagenome]
MHLLETADPHRLATQARGGPGLAQAGIEGGDHEPLLPKIMQILPRAAARLQQVRPRRQAGQEGIVGLAEEGRARRQLGATVGIGGGWL